MASVNKCIVVGYVGGDPESKNVKGTLVAKFQLATNQRWTDKQGEVQERTEWHSVTVWGKTAKVVVDYLKKGDPVYIEGRLQTDSWEVDKDGVQHACGQKHYKTHIIGERLQLLRQRDTSINSVLEQAGPEPLESPAGSSTQVEDLPL